MGWSVQESTADHSAGCNRFTGAGRGISRHTVRELLFFTLLFLYLWHAVEPHLIFHGSDRITNFPSFYATWSFLVSHLGRPGGPVEYVAALLSQLFYLSWLGALVIAMQAWAFARVVACLLRKAGLDRVHGVAYVPALLLLAIYGRYTYFFPTTMALLCALATASIHARLADGEKPVIAAVSFLALSPACYYVAGAAVLILALTCAIPDLLSSGRRRLAVLYALVGGGLPCVLGVKVFGLSVSEAYSDLLPVSWKLLHFAARRRGVEMVYALYLLAPAAMAVGGIVSLLWAGARRADKKVSREPKRRSVLGPKTAWLACTASLVAVGAAVAWGSFDRRQKTHFAVDYYAYHGMWAEVLVEGRHDPGDPFVMHAVNRALYHTGQLGDRMFAWPQSPASLFLTGAEHRWGYWRSFALHLELGFVNFAENALMECLAGMGDRPMILQQLALINMVKGNPDTARVYLRALSATLFHRRWAKRYLRLLERDPDLATDPDVQGLRAVALPQDYPSLDLPAETLLSCLLEKNRANRMAFEYLMAWYLSNRQLTRFVKRLEGLHEQGFRALPRHYEEAIMIYAATARTTVPLRGYEPREEVRRRMEHFLGILQSHGGNRQTAFADLAKHHGDSYAFYNVYGPREKAR